MADVEVYLYLLLVAAVTAVFLYVATRLVSKEEMIDAPYALRLFVAALVIVVLARALGDLGLGVLGVIVVFLAMVVVIRYLIIEAVGLGDEWVESLLVALVTIIFLYVLQLVLGVLGINLALFFLAVA
jgi:hypothetical protein